MPRPRYLSMSLVLLVTAVFFPVCGYDFLNFDDNVNIYSNGLVSHPTIEGVLQFWTAPFEGLYIPLTYSLWAILAKIAALFPLSTANHLNPYVFHGANLLVHALSTLVLFRILRLLLANDWAAAGGALFFAIHPVQVEAVAWATGMKDLLSGLLALLSLWQYLLSLGEGGLAPRRRKVHYGLAGLFFLASLLAKPGAVALPLVAGLLGYLLLKRTIPQLARTLLPLLLLAIPVVIVTKLSQPGTAQEFVPALWQRIFVVGDALSFYLAKLLLPINLGPDYGRTPAAVLSQGRVYAVALIPSLLIGVGLWRFRHPWAMAAAGVFVALLLPVLGFLPFDYQTISTVADRYLYLALLGPALGVGWLLARYPAKGVRIGVGVILLLLAGQAMATVSHWQDSLTLFPHALAVNPRSWVVHNIVAAAEIDRKHYAEAVAAAERSITANPGYGAAYFNLGLALEKLRRNEEAVAAYRKAVELRPTFLPAYANLAVLTVDLGRVDEAGVLLQKAMEIYTGTGGRVDAGLSENRASLYNALGRWYGAQNQLDQAVEAYQQAISAAPFFPEAYNNLGSAYLGATRYPEALEAYQQAIKLSPTVAAFHNNLCNVFNLLNRNDEALASCRTAMDLDPLYADPYLNLGNVMMAFNKTEEALAAYRKALELAPSFDVAAFNLGLVYQSLGNSGEALTFYRRAIEIRPEFAEAHEALGGLYQQLNMVPEAQAEFDKVRELAR